MQLYLEQYGFELHRSSYTEIFFNTYYLIHNWLNPWMWDQNPGNEGQL